MEFNTPLPHFMRQGTKIKKFGIPCLSHGHDGLPAIYWTECDDLYWAQWCLMWHHKSQDWRHVVNIFLPETKGFRSPGGRCKALGCTGIDRDKGRENHAALREIKFTCHWEPMAMSGLPENSHVCRTVGLTTLQGATSIRQNTENTESAENKHRKDRKEFV